MKLVCPLSCVLLLLGSGVAKAQPPPTPPAIPLVPPPGVFQRFPPGPIQGTPPPPPPSGLSPPMRVMSDTPEFCAQLAQHFARVRATRSYMPPDSVALASEGEHLCTTGRVRAGIARLRMAFFAIRPDR
jgi:hypothetical protein